MTREEAIAKAAEVKDTRPAPLYNGDAQCAAAGNAQSLGTLPMPRPPADVLVDRLIALGLLKLEEPPKTPEQQVFDILTLEFDVSPALAPPWRGMPVLTQPPLDHAMAPQAGGENCYVWRPNGSESDMASSKRTTGATAARAQAGSAIPTGAQQGPAGADERLAGAGDQARADASGNTSGPVSATPVDRVTISCLTNAQYHSCREAFLDTVHRWFMFAVIALGAAALTDALPKLLHSMTGLPVESSVLKEVFAASAAILAALDLTFDLSNRARAHAMMKRRYYELLAHLREGHKTPEAVHVCLEQFSADEEPLYRVLFLACWNAAQQSVYGDKAMRFDISFLGNMFKNWWRRPAANYKVVGG